MNDPIYFRATCLDGSEGYGSYEPPYPHPYVVLYREQGGLGHALASSVSPVSRDEFHAALHRYNQGAWRGWLKPAP